MVRLPWAQASSRALSWALGPTKGEFPKHWWLEQNAPPFALASGDQPRPENYKPPRAGLPRTSQHNLGFKLAEPSYNCILFVFTDQAEFSLEICCLPLLVSVDFVVNNLGWLQFNNPHKYYRKLNFGGNKYLQNCKNIAANNFSKDIFGSSIIIST